MEDTDFGGLARDLERDRAKAAAEGKTLYDFRAARSVPRHDEEGGASAPPDSICPRHHVAYDSAYHCMICERERPRQDLRVVSFDDNHSVYVSTHNAPLTPEQAIRLAATLLDSALRILDRRDDAK